MFIKHKLATQAKISPKLLNDETLLILGNGNCLRDQVLQACKNVATTNNISNQIISSSIETIKYMVEMNISISILPKIAQINLPPILLLNRLVEIKARSNTKHCNSKKFSTQGIS